MPRPALAIGALIAASILAALLLRGLDPSSDETDAPERAASTAAKDPRETNATLRAPPASAAPRREATPMREEEPAPEGSILVTGRVFDVPRPDAWEERVPASAGVRVEQSVFMRGAETAPATVTDEEGRFRLILEDDGQRPRKIKLWARGDERLRNTIAERSLQEGETTVSGVELDRYPLGVVHGVALDFLDVPLAEVEVRLPYADPELTTFSDDEGRFRFDEPTQNGDMAVRKDGYVVLEAKRPRMLDAGGWEEARVVLAPAGSLRVVVTDGARAPLAGLRVDISVAAAEPHGRGRGRSFGLNRLNHLSSVDTAIDGVAWFPEVWAGQRLRVEVGAIETGFERIRHEGATALAAAEDGEPIVVDPGREREVHVRLPGAARVSGSVAWPDGSPAPNAGLHLRTADVPSKAPGYAGVRGKADANGAFELVLYSDQPLGTLRLSATDRSNLFAFRSRPEDELAAAWVDLETTESPMHEGVQLVLGPVLAIGGRVVDGEGRALSGRAYVHRAGAESHELRSPFGLSHSNHFGKNGRFRVLGLAAGRYDVEIEPEGKARAWVRDVAAGEEGLLVVASAPRSVVVHVDVASDIELEQVILLSGRFRPHSSSSLAAMGSAGGLASRTYEGPGGWPERMLTLWYGSGGGTDEYGSSTFHLFPAKELPHTFELDEGAGWIGVKARTKDGAYTFPVGTGLVQLGAGEYTLTFRQELGSRVEGRVTGAPADAELHVAIARKGGELLMLDVRQRFMQETTALGAQGTFAFPLVPAGQLELRVGTLAELTTGRWQQREPFVAEGGAAVALQVRF